MWIGFDDCVSWGDVLVVEVFILSKILDAEGSLLPNQVILQCIYFRG
jgi:hypothetical protein